LALTFPIIREPDDEALYPTVDTVAGRLTADILFPCTARIDEQLKAMGYERQSSQFPIWRRWMESFIAGECLRELLRRGVLPSPGDPVPTNFSMIGWYAKPNAPHILTWGYEEIFA
jgi:hypothetical protein